MTEKRFVKYDGNTIVDLKLVQSWIISNGNVDELLNILNEITLHKELKKLGCGNCKHFQVDGMFGTWCDINDTDYLCYKGEEDCPNFERS